MAPADVWRAADARAVALPRGERFESGRAVFGDRRALLASARVRVQSLALRVVVPVGARGRDGRGHGHHRHAARRGAFPGGGLGDGALRAEVLPAGDLQELRAGLVPGRRLHVLEPGLQERRDADRGDPSGLDARDRVALHRLTVIDTVAVDEAGTSESTGRSGTPILGVTRCGAAP